MVRVRLYYRRGRLRGLVVEGHAGSGVYGRDIVCAAVSALAQTAVLALERLAGVKPRGRVQAGRLQCFLPGGLAHESEEKAALILETAAVGLAAIAHTHPRHVILVRRGLGSAEGGGPAPPGLPQEEVD